jgi:predicted aldo/keto reductase-like oxidoreductase
MAPLILSAIQSDKFDFINLHFHFIGSYTSTGSGSTGGNFAAIRAAQKHDMGVFIISPNDKGGMLCTFRSARYDLLTRHSATARSQIYQNDYRLLAHRKSHTELFLPQTSRPRSWQKPPHPSARSTSITCFCCAWIRPYHLRT